MPKATLSGVTLAESNETEVVEGNHYFPPESVNMEYMRESQSMSRCPWKGQASYYSVKVGADFVRDAAWFYPDPKDAAKNIQNYVAFYTSKVELED